MASEQDLEESDWLWESSQRIKKPNKSKNLENYYSQ